jgi:hypothetical protein
MLMRFLIICQTGSKKMKKDHYILTLLLACALLSTSLISPVIADDPLFQEGVLTPPGSEGAGEFISTGDPDDAITGEKFIPDPGPVEEEGIIGDTTGIDDVVDILIDAARMVGLFF